MSWARRRVPEDDLKTSAASADASGGDSTTAITSKQGPPGSPAIGLPPASQSLRRPQQPAYTNERKESHLACVSSFSPRRPSRSSPPRPSRWRPTAPRSPAAPTRRTRRSYTDTYGIADADQQLNLRRHPRGQGRQDGSQQLRDRQVPLQGLGRRAPRPARAAGRLRSPPTRSSPCRTSAPAGTPTSTALRPRRWLVTSTPRARLLGHRHVPHQLAVQRWADCSAGRAVLGRPCQAGSSPSY